MWRLFDYASISTTEATAKPLSGIGRPPAEADRHLESDSASQQPPPEQPSNATPSVDFSSNIPTQDILQSSDIPPTSTESTLFDPDSFSDLPEEWMMNDWTLFGAPLSAYHSGFDS
jgi:hypothetical protein